MYLDIFIAVVVLYALWKGWTNGMLKEAVSMLGFIFGLVIACLFYGNLGEYLTVDGSSTNVFTSIVAFMILWIVSPIALGTVATLMTQALKHVRLLSLPNRLGGVALSLLKYILLLSLVLNAMSSLHILSEKRSEGSILLQPVTGVTSLLSRSVINTASSALKGEDKAAESDTVWIDTH